MLFPVLYLCVRMRLSRTNARAFKQVPETEIPVPTVTGPRAVLEAASLVDEVELDLSKYLEFCNAN